MFLIGIRFLVKKKVVCKPKHIKENARKTIVKRSIFNFVLNTADSHLKCIVVIDGRTCWAITPGIFLLGEMRQKKCSDK